MTTRLLRTLITTSAVFAVLLAIAVTSASAAPGARTGTTAEEPPCYWPDAGARDVPVCQPQYDPCLEPVNGARVACDPCLQPGNGARGDCNPCGPRTEINPCDEEKPVETVVEEPVYAPVEIDDAPVNDRGSIGPAVVAGEAAAPEAVAGAGSAPSGSLPYTGGPVVWIALLGSMMLVGGVVLFIELRRGRRDEDGLDLA